MCAETYYESHFKDQRIFLNVAPVETRSTILGAKMFILAVIHLKGTRARVLE